MSDETESEQHFSDVPVRLEVPADSHEAAAAEIVTRERIIAYMEGCPLILSARTQSPDRIDPTGSPVSVAFRTDGVWVWSLEAETYVVRYGMTVPEAFLLRIKDLGTSPEVTESVRKAAFTWVRNAWQRDPNFKRT